MNGQYFSAIATACLLSAGTAGAQTAPILDYTNPLPDVALSAEPAEVAELLDLLALQQPNARDSLGNEPQFLGRVQGSFSQPGAQEDAWLLSNRQPVIADPNANPELPLLVITDPATGVVAAGRPDPNASHYALRAAADADADGIDSLLLEGGAMNMGIIDLRLDAVELRDGAFAVTTSWQAYYDSCEQSLAPRQQRGTVFHIRDGHISAGPMEMRC